MECYLTDSNSAHANYVKTSEWKMIHKNSEKKIMFQNLRSWIWAVLVICFCAFTTLSGSDCECWIYGIKMEPYFSDHSKSSVNCFLNDRSFSSEACWDNLGRNASNIICTCVWPKASRSCLVQHLLTILIKLHLSRPTFLGSVHRTTLIVVLTIDMYKQDRWIHYYLIIL